MKALGFGYSSRQGAKTQNFWDFLASYFAPLRLCGKYCEFGCLQLSRVGKTFFHGNFSRTGILQSEISHSERSERCSSI